MVSRCGGLAVIVQEANSWDLGLIPGRETSFEVPESSCLLSCPWLQLRPRYIGGRGWFGGSSAMPGAGEEGSVTGTMKHVKSSVARTGSIVLRWSSGYGTGGQFLRPGFNPRSRDIFWWSWIFPSRLWPLTPTGNPLQIVNLDKIPIQQLAMATEYKYRPFDNQEVRTNQTTFSHLTSSLLCVTVPPTVNTTLEKSMQIPIAACTLNSLGTIVEINNYYSHYFAKTVTIFEFGLK